MISWVYIPFKTLVTLELRKKHSLFSLSYGCIKIFVKHIGTNTKYSPILNEFKIAFNRKKRELHFTQPILNEDLRYTIYLDKMGNLQNKGYSLCTLAEVSKLAHYTQTFDSDQLNVSQIIDFNKTELKGYECFDVLVLAQEKNNGQFMILSDVQSYLRNTIFYVYLKFFAFYSVKTLWNCFRSA